MALFEKTGRCPHLSYCIGAEEYRKVNKLRRKREKDSKHKIDTLVRHLANIREKKYRSKEMKRRIENRNRPQHRAIIVDALRFEITRHRRTHDRLPEPMSMPNRCVESNRRCGRFATYTRFGKNAYTKPQDG